MFDAGKLRVVESLSAAGWSLRAAEVGRSLNAAGWSLRAAEVGRVVECSWMVVAGS